MPPKAIFNNCAKQLQNNKIHPGQIHLADRDVLLNRPVRLLNKLPHLRNNVNCCRSDDTGHSPGEGLSKGCRRVGHQPPVTSSGADQPPS
jgi:hypothetical protein